MNEVKKEISELLESNRKFHFLAYNEDDLIREATIDYLSNLCSEIKLLQYQCKYSLEYNEICQFHDFKTQLTNMQTKYRKALEYLSSQN